ncbi:MAG: polyphosphate kinase 2, partial [Planctomycetia bacterium]|nr:polyphosphate kinase 2 [Planctomycetia bacterium]
KTSTDFAPWYIIRSDDKHQARRQTLKLILNSVRYRNRNAKLNFKIDPKTVITAEREIKIMKKQRKKYGKFMR